MCILVVNQFQCEQIYGLNITTQVLWSQILIWWFEIPKHWCIMCLCSKGFFLFMQLSMVYGVYISVSMFWTWIPTFFELAGSWNFWGKNMIKPSHKAFCLLDILQFFRLSTTWTLNVKKVMRVNTTCSPSLSSFKAILNKLSINFQCLFWLN